MCGIATMFHDNVMYSDTFPTFSVGLAQENNHPLDYNIHNNYLQLQASSYVLTQVRVYYSNTCLDEV